MKIGILTFEKFHRKPFNSIGSSRIRVNDMVKYWDDAEIYKYGQKYDVMIYQKVYWTEHAKTFRGLKILDICDADFMHWGYKTIEMLQYCDALVTPTQKLAVALARYTDKPVWVIPDRMDLNNYPHKKTHTGKAKKIGWYGYAQNFHIVNESGIMKALYDLNKKAADLEFIAISNGMYVPPAFAKDAVKITNYRWSLKTVNQDIQKCDIIINPKLESGPYQYKSNNKTLHALALGVPVAHDLNELLALMDGDARNTEIEEKTKLLKDKYHITQSVEEYKNLIKDIYVSAKKEVDNS